MDSFNPGAWGPVYIGTWAGRPDAATLPTGTRIVITDVGNQGPFEMQVVGGVWRLLGATELVHDHAPVVGVAQTALQLIRTTAAFPLPPGFILSLRHVSIKTQWSKSGATDSSSSLSMRIGPVGVNSEAVISNTSASAATTRSVSTELLYRAVGNTTIEHLARGSNSGVGSGFVGTQSLDIAGTVIPTGAHNMSTQPSVFSHSCTSSGATDSWGVTRVMLTGY